MKYFNSIKKKSTSLSSKAKKIKIYIKNDYIFSIMLPFLFFSFNSIILDSDLSSKQKKTYRVVSQTKRPNCPTLFFR